MHRIVNGDILRFAAHYNGPRFHAVLCDPPYELGFMGKSWDSRGVSFRAETWAAIRSLLVPGAHLLAFGGTRTFHRIAVAIEDAGFEIRDTLGWLYGSGFPKSHDVSKAIDREAGAERQKIPNPLASKQTASIGTNAYGDYNATTHISPIPATDAARAWQGYGTALKPAWEPVIIARNPLAGTVAANAQKFGCGALNVDGGRIKGDSWKSHRATGLASKKFFTRGEASVIEKHPHDLGRWPANIIHDGSDEIAEVIGDAQRFFYCTKASRREREEGLDGFELRVAEAMSGEETRDDRPTNHPLRANNHPTVKPLALTEYLARLILPASIVTDRRILVPFAGSGSECIGAALAGWDTVIGVEREAEYARITRARLAHWMEKRAVQEVLA